MQLSPNVKAFCANTLCFIILLIYTLIGGFIFLYFEYDHSVKARRIHNERKIACIVDILDSGDLDDPRTANGITQKCLVDLEFDPRREWNLKNALLYGFGILTTLGYGKIEPMTIKARMFTVVWGFIGVPFTVIILTNLGLYMRSGERYLRRRWCRKSDNQQSEKSHWLLSNSEVTDRETITDGDSSSKKSLGSRSTNMSPLLLATVVFLYLVIGAIFMPLLNGKMEFINGLYYSYLCFTAIEFGALVPKNTGYIPIVIVYMCIGLAMSTIALDLGSKYVKKLYFIGRRMGNIANVKIWFGGKSLQVKDLVVALGQAIGVNPESFSQLDINQVVKDAILVKEGRLNEVPQAYTFMEGIWPPELIPLFLKSGSFPEFVDADSRNGSLRTKNSDLFYSNYNIYNVESISLSTFWDGRLHRSLNVSRTSSSNRKDDQNNNVIV
ncbi:ion channel domain-containing protein [Ditylenchus destructor]|nr:ion channel domain-containing protein [Ditylenchus destructor]